MAEIGIRNFLWSAFERGGALVLSFIANLFLVRLLSPSDFGLISVISVLIAIAHTTTTGGFAAALIQRKALRDAHLNAAFMWNMGISLLLYAILYTIAPGVSAFFSKPELAPILRALALVVPIQGLYIVHYSLILREARLRTLTLISVASTALGSSIAVGYAYLGGGVWALVLNTLAVTAVATLLYWLYSPWRPNFRSDWQSFREIFAFGGYMYLSTLCETIYANAQSAIIGRLFSGREAGIYFQAQKLQNVPLQVSHEAITQVVYPYSSTLQDSHSGLLRFRQRHVETLSWLGWPVVALMITIADSLIPLLYGGQWSEAIPLFRMLCVGGMFALLAQGNMNIIKAKGNSRAYLLVNLLVFALGLASLVLFSTNTLSLSALVVAGNLLFFLLGWWASSRGAIGPSARILWDAVAPALAIAPVVVLLLWARSICEWGCLPTLLLQAGLLIVYVILLYQFVIRPRPYLHILEYISKAKELKCKA